MSDMITKHEVLMQLGELAEGELLLKGAQLFPIGEWSHPDGKVRIDYPRAQHFAEQFNQRKAGQRLPVFYIHSAQSNVANPQYGKAAGWFADMRADETQGVLIDIEFTEAGAEAVRKGEYKYLSAEYFDKVQLPHHKTPQQDVIMGAALVNRPHLKGMNPILNEETGHQFISVAESTNEGGPMDPVLVQLAELAGVELSEDDEQLTDEQRSAIKTYLESNETRVKDLEATAGILTKKLEAAENPIKAKAKNLAEAGFAEEAALLTEYRGDHLMKQLSEPLEAGSKLSPAVEAKIREYADGSDDKHLQEAFKLVASGKGIVDLTEKGSGGNDDDEEATDSDAGDKLVALADALAKDKEIQFDEALDLVSAENPELWNSYQKFLGSPRAMIGGE